MTHEHDELELNDAALRELAQRLGTRAAERLDVAALAERVVAQLRAAPRPARSRWLEQLPVWLRIAAVVTVMVGTGLVLRGGVVHVGQPPRQAIAPAPAGVELTGLSTEQLRQVLGALEETGPSPETVAADDTGVEDLTVPELRALLAALEG